MFSGEGGLRFFFWASEFFSTFPLGRRGTKRDRMQTEASQQFVGFRWGKRPVDKAEPYLCRRNMPEEIPSYENPPSYDVRPCLRITGSGGLGETDTVNQGEVGLLGHIWSASRLGPPPNAVGTLSSSLSSSSSSSSGHHRVIIVVVDLISPENYRKLEK